MFSEVHITLLSYSFYSTETSMWLEMFSKQKQKNKQISQPSEHIIGDNANYLKPCTSFNFGD